MPILVTPPSLPPPLPPPPLVGKLPSIFGPFDDNSRFVNIVSAPVCVQIKRPAKPCWCWKTLQGRMIHNNGTYPNTTLLSIILHTGRKPEKTVATRQVYTFFLPTLIDTHHQPIMYSTYIRTRNIYDPTYAPVLRSCRFDKNILNICQCLLRSKRGLRLFTGTRTQNPKQAHLRGLGSIFAPPKHSSISNF